MVLAMALGVCSACQSTDVVIVGHEQVCYACKHREVVQLPPLPRTAARPLAIQGVIALAVGLGGTALSQAYHFGGYSVVAYGAVFYGAWALWRAWGASRR